MRRGAFARVLGAKRQSHSTLLALARGDRAAALGSGVTYETLLAEKAWRNRDNVARTAAYLELYLIARDRGEDLPWLLMAHLVSRHARYLMTDVGAQIEAGSPFSFDASCELFLFLERANFLIFDDAWHHVLCHLMRAPKGQRTARYLRDEWGRYESEAWSRPSERRMVLALVTNEQQYIERRVVHNRRFARALAMVRFFESVGLDARVSLPLTNARIKVGNFASVDRRIEAGRRIYDEVLADTDQRAALCAWSIANPHTGARSVVDPKGSTRTLRETWPVERVRGLSSAVHAAPEPDPHW